jgi:hypothetical protein
MTSRFLQALLVAGVFLLSIGGSANAQQSKRAQAPTFDELASSIKSQTGGRLVKAQNGVPQVILGAPGARVLASSKTSTPQAIANTSKEYFYRTATEVGFLPASAELNTVTASPVGRASNTVITLSYNGIPVRERKANVALGANGELVMMRNNLPSVEPNIAEPVITASTVAAKAKLSSARTATNFEEPKLVYVADRANTELRLAYEVRVTEQSPAHYWRYTFDAETGDLIEKKDLIVYCMDPSHDHADVASAEPAPAEAAPATPQATVTGTVKANILPKSPFHGDTTVTLPFVKVTVNGKSTFADANGNWTAEGVDYPLTISSNLESRFFNVRRADATSGSLSTTISAGVAELNWAPTVGISAERSAYYSAHKVYQHVKSFDPSFTQIDRKIPININVNGECNAFYHTGEKSLNFFPQSEGGCSNTAEIADVVYHEYGHHYHHVRYQAQGTDVNSSALGEGVADILSNLLRDDPVIGDGFTGKGSILRTSKNTKKWPTAVSTDPHGTGGIVAGAVWDLRLAIGLERTAYLFHEALKGVPDASASGEDADAALEAFTDVLLAFLLADDDDANLQNGTPNSAAIIKAFDLHGIGFSNLMDVEIAEIPDQTKDALQYPVSVTAQYNGVIGEVDHDSVKVYYVIGNGPLAHINLIHTGGNTYQGFIPQVPAGSIVRYYATVRTNLEGTASVRAPLGNQTRSFAVGYETKYLDNAESEVGMRFGINTDVGTSGIWERGIPNSTVWFDNSAFQLGYDHSDDGEYAYITGNGNAPGANATTDALFDWSTTVKTTMETPSINVTGLKSPVLKFHYYQRSEDAKNTFRVQITTNNGASWRTLYQSNESFPTWTGVIQPLGFEPLGETTVKFRFIANATAGTIVEAGVDDISIMVPQGVASVGAQSPEAISLSVYPNPVVKNGNLNFTYTLPSTSIVKAELKNVMGSAVWSMDGELKTTGSYSESVALDLPSGTYYLQLTTSEGMYIKQVHVVK